MKQKLLCLLAAFAFLLPARLSAFDYTYEGSTLTYEVLDEEAKTCMVNSYISRSDPCDLIIPDVANDGTTDYSVTSIGAEAFFYGIHLTSVVIPNSVTSIGDEAFHGSGLTSVVIGNSVTSIGKMAFEYCKGLTSVVIGNSVTSIGDEAFYGCEGLTSVVIPNSVTSIGKMAFYLCSHLTSVVIPKSVTSIGDKAFSGSGLMKSAYPNTLNNPFPNMVKAVAYNPDEAFIEDGWIWSLDKSSICFAPLNLEGEYSIPESVTSIGDDAFGYCSNLTSVVIPKSVISIGYEAFFACGGLTSVVIGNSVTSIGDKAFEFCHGLTSVVIPKSVTSIGDDVFYGCSGLIKSAYPNTLNNPFGSFGEAVAYNPDEDIIENGWIWSQDKSSIYFAPLNLEGEYSIPESVTSIGAQAFYGCSGLTLITALSDSPAVMNDNSFEGLYDIVKLAVPDDCVNKYLATNWTLFKNIQNNSGNELGYFSDGVLEYRLNPSDMTATVVGAKNYSGLQIPERFTDDSDAANPVRYYIKGIGYKAFYDKNVTSVEFNSRSQMEYIGDYAFTYTKISSLSLPETTKTIGEYAFYGTGNLSEVELKEGLQSIANYAFAQSAISSISIPASVSAIGEYAFYRTGNLSEVELKEGLQSICNYAFAQSALGSISIPASVSAIGEYAFYKTGNLSKVELKEGLVSIGVGAFASTNNGSGNEPLYIPSTVQTIGTDAFDNFGCSKVEISDLEAWLRIDFGNTSSNPLHGNGLYVKGEPLVRLHLGKGIEEIKPYSFYDCSSLTEVEFSEGLQKIGYQSFMNCANITSIKLPASLKSIDEYSFYGCDKITGVTIPSGVTEIGNNVFAANSLTFADGITELNINNDSFYNGVSELYWGRPLESLTLGLDSISSLEIGNLITEIPADRFKGLKNLKSLSLGNSVENIGNGAFSGCSVLTDLKFVGELQSIGDKAFSGCTSLKEVILPPSVETIGASAFSGNSNLKSIIMGHSVRSIGEKAFDGCKANTVSITAQTPPTAPNNTFSSYSGKLYLQGQEAVDAYYDAFTCWDRFDSYVMIDAEQIKVEGADKIYGKAGDTFQLTATVWPENVTLPQIFWRSTNPEIATVDANGLVTLQVDLDSLNTRAEGEGDIDGKCTIIAETLYNDGPVTMVEIDTTGANAVESITAGGESDGSIDYTRPYEVYNMNGFKVGETTEGLANGIYIIRQDNAAVKTLVR